MMTLLAQLTTELPPLPSTVPEFWTYGIAVVAPVIIYVLRMLVPKVPAYLLPILAPFVGLLLGLGLNAVTNANLSWVDSAQLGALAVWVRETVHNFVKLRQQT